MRLLSRHARAFGIALALAPAVAGAQVVETPAPEPPPPPVPPALVAPHLVRDPGATYPAQALRDRVHETVTVPLVLTLDATGAVRNVTVLTPQGHGFDEAATLAAQGIVFEPATHDGRPVAAKINYAYVFEPPAPRLVGRVAQASTDRPIAGAEVSIRGAGGAVHVVQTAPDGTWSAPAVRPGSVHVTVVAPGYDRRADDETIAPGEETRLVVRLANSAAPSGPSPALEGMDEVKVRGERPPREVVKRTLEADEIAHIPGTNGDALRSLTNLPGVARPPPFRGLLVVRGSAPQDTRIFVDGTNIPIVYHFGGLSSVVPTEVLQKIDFYPGNYSSQYGRGMGGIVDVGLRTPKADGYHGLAQIDLIDARVLAEGKIPLGEGWSFLVAGRRTTCPRRAGSPIRGRCSPTGACPKSRSGSTGM